MSRKRKSPRCASQLSCAVRAAWLIAVTMVLEASGAGQPAAAAGPTEVRAVPARARAGDAYRPQYHFTAQRHWLNDPNGLVYFEGEYHLFYQYNPFGDRWGHMSWGHAISTDLVHWRELPVAIPEDRDYMIFSGSVVVDAGNSSGFGAEGRTPLVAIYTGYQRHGAGLQNQQLAFSLDRGRTWTQYAGNPVLDLGLKEFRDPKVFWHAAAHEWIMVAVLSDQKRAAFFSSPDLKQWRHVGDFGPAGAIDGNWECPDLIELPVTGGSRWVFKVDVFKSRVAGAGAQYFVGEFDGRAFTALPGETGRVVDWGRDFYAAASWAHLPAGDGRHVWIGWMNNHEYAQDVPTAPWRGAMSAPRSLSLRERNGSFELLQSPAAELESLRTHHRRVSGVRLAGAGPERVLSTPVVPRLSASAEIIATLQPGSSMESGLLLRVGGRQRTVVGYDAARGQLFIDRIQSGAVGFSDRFPSRQSAPFLLDRGELKLHILLDRSSIEVFAGEGELVMTDQIFPASTSVGLRGFARGGTASLRSVDLWDLGSARGR